MYRLVFKAAGVLFLSVAAAIAGISADNHTLRVSTIVVPPLVVQEKADGAISGSAVAAVHRLAESCGIKAKIIITPSWNRAYTMAQQGIADGVIPANFAKERLEFFDFSRHPLVDMRPGLIVRKDSPIRHFTGLDILEGKRVGVRTNALLEVRFDAYMRSGKATLVERSDSPSLVDELLSGRVDFIADSPAMIIYHMAESKVPERIRILEPPLGTSGQYLALSKKRAAPVAPGTDISQCLMASSILE